MLFGKKKTSTPRPVSVEEEMVKNLEVHHMPAKYLSTIPKPGQEKKTQSGTSSDKKWLIVGGVGFVVVGVALVGFFIFSSGNKSTTTKPKNTQTSPAQPLVPEEKKEPEKTPEPPPTPVTESDQPVPKEDTTAEPTPNRPAELSAAVDSDQDGLSDAEESLYHTHLRKSDSDADGYSDAEELKNLYDPASAGTKLETSSNIKIFQHTVIGSSKIYYPISWQVNMANIDKKSVNFIAEDQNMITFLVTSLGENDTFQAWYESIPDTDDFSNLSPVTYGSLSGYTTSDGLGVYLLGSDKQIFLFRYDPKSTNILSYMTTFQMMLKSFSQVSTTGL